jgi:small multidrug resistance pump
MKSALAEQRDAKGGLSKMFYLMLAIVAEVAGTTSIKLSEGFTRMVPSVAIFVFYGLSLGMLNLALKQIDLSFAYAVWSGIGMALIATVGIVWFSEPTSALKMASLGLIAVGIVGLRLSGGVS